MAVVKRGQEICTDQFSWLIESALPTCFPGYISCTTKFVMEKIMTAPRLWWKLTEGSQVCSLKKTFEKSKPLNQWINLSNEKFYMWIVFQMDSFCWRNLHENNTSYAWNNFPSMWISYQLNISFMWIIYQLKNSFKYLIFPKIFMKIPLQWKTYLFYTFKKRVQSIFLDKHDKCSSKKKFRPEFCTLSKYSYKCCTRCG